MCEEGGRGEGKDVDGTIGQIGGMYTDVYWQNLGEESENKE